MTAVLHASTDLPGVCAAASDAPEAALAHPHVASPDAVLRAWGSDAIVGLAPEVARRRLAEHGPNRLAAMPETPWWRRLAEQFASVLVLILVAAAGISIVEWLLQDPREEALPYEAIVILAIVALNALLGYVQEARSERMLRALADLASPEASVVRGGERVRVPAEALVPGDLLLIAAGDRIAADARLVEAVALAADEAALTGESLPVAKSTGAVAPEAALGDRQPMLYAGTVATSGRGRAVVVATGTHTQIGRIAGLIDAAEKEPTPLQQELDRTGRRLSLVMLGICAAVFAVGLATSPLGDRGSILKLFLFAVALAVAAIPEALPAIVTVGLSLGVRRMAGANALVRKLPAVETLGAATVICSDKTGTLTRNEMTVRALYVAGRLVEVDGSGYVPEGAFRADGGDVGGDPALHAALRRCLVAGALANDAALVTKAGRWRIDGDPTEGALVVAARKLSLDLAALARWPRLSELAFTSERKRHTTVHADREAPGTLLVCTKGAVEAVLARCSREATPDGDAALGDARRRDILAAAEGMAAGALRVLAIAARALPRADVLPDGGGSDSAHSGDAGAAMPAPGQVAGLERDLVFLGLAGMLDPPRPEAQAAVAAARSAGIRSIMITGDHPTTAAAIARELGILEPGARMLAGADLAAMSDGDLDACVEQVRVYARVDPEHKLRIVRSLQRKGHIVAMTGDGVNDAPALKAANIGVAMGISGTDVSKEAADMVLTDDNFASIVRAIEEGRGIFENIRKYLIYLLSSNTGELLTMFAGVMLAGALGLVPAEPGLFLPLLAAQLLWINLITDGPPALALAFEPRDADLMARPPRRHGDGVLSPNDWAWLLIVGAIMMLGTLAVLDAYYPGGFVSWFATGTAPNPLDEARARTAAFTTLMLFQLVHVFIARSDRRSAFAGLASNGWLVAAVVLSLAAHALVVYVPVLQSAFHTAPLAPGDWLLAAVVAASLLVVTEIAKARRRVRAG